MVGNYSFPRLDTVDSKKDKKYHEDFARAIVNRSVDDSWRNNYNLMAELYTFLEEGSSGYLTQHLQKAPDGTDLPAVWKSLNSIPTKVDLLVGELETRGYDIRVRGLNKEMIDRKLEKKEQLRVKRKLGPLFREADKDAQVPVGESEYVPQTEKELDEYIDLSFKDKAEIIMEAALKWLAKRNEWDEERKTLMRDILIVGRAWVRNEIVRGIPRSRRIHPLSIIFDTKAKKDDLSDATYFGEMEYLSFSSAAERYNLTSAEIEEVYNKYKEYSTTTPATEAISPAADYSYSFNTIGGKQLSWFKESDGELRVLVARAVWRDYKVLRYKDETNAKYGTEYLQKLENSEQVRERDKDKIVSKKFEMWRQCTIIGGHVVREWGEAPNQPRDISDIALTEPPYKGWIPNFSTGRGVSKVEQMASIQLQKDILNYNLELAVVRAGARGISYDLAMKPDTMTIEQVMKYLKVFGVTFYNSKDFQYLPGSNTSPFREFDMSMSDSVIRYVELMKYLDSEMDRISGVSPERQGGLQGASQGLGVTQAAVFQSNLITQPYFVGFERFCSRVLNQQAKMVKIAWAGKEVFAPVIGTTGVDFLKEHIDLEFEDFAVFVESIPPMLQDRNKFEQFVLAVVQNNPEFVDDAIDILLEPDLRVATRKFKRKRALRKIFEMQQMQMQQQQQANLEQRLAAIEAEGREREIEAGLEETRMKNEGGLQKTLATGRVKLSSDGIKSTTELIKNRNDNEQRSKEIVASNQQKSKLERSAKK